MEETEELALSSDIDVLVVGAGLTGLVTAYKILQKDPQLKVLVIEASDRIGGQILTGSEGELGPRWFDEHQRHVHILCEELGIGVCEVLQFDMDLCRDWEIDDGFWSYLARWELDRFMRYLDIVSKEFIVDK